MEILVIAYTIAWAAVSAYIIRLAVVNRQLSQRVRRLVSLVSKPKSRTDSLPRVA